MNLILDLFQLLRHSIPMTGPTSAAGKARSSQNATKHGLTARNLSLSPEQQSHFQSLEDDLRARLRPVGAFEKVFFDSLAHAIFRLQFAQKAEDEALELFSEDPENHSLRLRWERFSRYRRSHERSAQSALRNLRLAQENRFLEENMNLPSHIPVSPILPLRQILKDFKKIQNELPKPPATNPQAFTPNLDSPLVRHIADTYEALKPTLLSPQGNLSSRSGFTLALSPPLAASA
ncbi:MAG: hypothetical protein NW208_00420 [Bryobacter sp.]|nr:hypothetical protein [Bryobacter sp.]